VVVPDVTGELLGDAGIKIDEVGHLTWAPIGETSNQIEACTVTDQDAVGPVSYGTEVLLTVNCPISRAQVLKAAVAHARKAARDAGGLYYDVHSCVVVGMNEGECDVLYSRTPGGPGCTTTIVVTEEPDTIRTHPKNEVCS
jgi:hypothetical protein